MHFGVSGSRDRGLRCQATLLLLATVNAILLSITQAAKGFFYRGGRYDAYSASCHRAFIVFAWLSGPLFSFLLS